MINKLKTKYSKGQDRRLVINLGKFLNIYGLGEVQGIKIKKTNYQKEISARTREIGINEGHREKGKVDVVDLPAIRTNVREADNVVLKS